MSRRFKKAEKTFDLLSVGRPPRRVKESQLRSQYLSLIESDRWGEILALTRQLGDQRGSIVWINNLYFKALEATGNHQSLLSEALRCLEDKPRDTTFLSWHAHALRVNGRVEESIDVLRRAVKLAKPNASLFNTLGSALKELGEFEEALSWFERALAIDPSLAKAHWNQSDLVKDHQVAIEAINRVVTAKRSDSSDQNLLHFSLYRHFEKLEDYESAFTNLEIANQMKRAEITYDSDQASKLTQEILDLFQRIEIDAPSEVRQHKSPNNAQPIFIFGLPRSGTTLVEQILASHSQVRGGNELTFLNDASTKQQAQSRLPGAFPFWMEKMPDSGWAQIGQNYLDLIKTLDVTEPRVTDKSLMNYRAAGLISRALPAAKMIHVVRSPMAVGFGCYRQAFGSGHLFSYSFEEIADMISDHQKLLAHWQKILPDNRYYVLDYQALVSDPELQISNLLKFCELEDEAACYSPEKTQRTVRTLSSTQVRQPINQSGLSGWKRYEPHLEPLKKALEARGLI